MIDYFKKKLRQMIKQAVLNLIDDTGPYPRGQATYNDKVTDFLHFIPYGLISNPPPESWVLLLQSQAQESNKVGLVADFINRKKNGIPGEAGLFNSITGTFILLDALGDVQIQTVNSLFATAVLNATITTGGTINLISTGAININSSGAVNMTSIGPTNITPTGDLNLGGPAGVGVARIGDPVAGGVITGGSTKVKAV